MLAEGDKTPAFKGVDQNGKTISFKDLKGKRLALYFYPQDMTETCTIQACNIRDNFNELKKNGITIIGISPDPVTSHKKFESKYTLPFPLIADTEHAIINAFGVWGEKQLFGRKYMGLLRTTFLINEKGIIRKVITKPKSKQHATEILDAWKSI
mgnify:CR=1 FL=1